MNTTKIKKSVLSMLLIPLAFSQNIFANECGTIIFSENEINNKTNILEMIGNNGMQVKKPKKFRDVANSTKSYHLEPGLHTLTVNQWVKKEFITHNKNIQRKRLIANPVEPIQRTILIDIEANQQYELTLGRSHNETVIVEKSTASKSCESSELLAAKLGQTKAVQAVLPIALENKLHLTMKKISAHNSNIKHNIFDHSLNQYFGTILTKTFALNNTALSVKSVLPFSFAAQLALKSGDSIVGLGGKKINVTDKSPSMVLNEYLSSIAYGKNIEIEVIRNNSNLSLNGTYIPVVLPDSFYKLGEGNNKQTVISQSELPKQLKFEYDQLLLAISDHYQKTGMLNQTIVIDNTAQTGNDLGYSLTVNLASIPQAHDNMLKESKRKHDLYNQWIELDQKRKRSGSDLNTEARHKKGFN